MRSIRLLEYSQEKIFLDYYNSLDIEDESKFFICHQMDVAALDELSLKRLLFEYQILVYCLIENDEISNFIIFQVPSIMKKTNALEVLLMGIFDAGFIKDVFIKVKENFQSKGWNKISLQILKFQANSNYDGLFEEISLQKEIELKSGQENYNQIFYTYTF